jgi:hypothetical protein
VVEGFVGFMLAGFGLGDEICDFGVLVLRIGLLLLIGFLGCWFWWMGNFWDGFCF